MGKLYFGTIQILLEKKGYSRRFVQEIYYHGVAMNLSDYNHFGERGRGGGAYRDILFLLLLLICHLRVYHCCSI